MKTKTKTPHYLKEVLWVLQANYPKAMGPGEIAEACKKYGTWPHVKGNGKKASDPANLITSTMESGEDIGLYGKLKRGKWQIADPSRIKPGKDHPDYQKLAGKRKPGRLTDDERKLIDAHRNNDVKTLGEFLNKAKNASKIAELTKKETELKADLAKIRAEKKKLA